MNHLIHFVSSTVFSPTHIAEIAVAALLAILTCLVSRRYSVLSAKFVGHFNASANRVTPYIFAAMLLPLVVRLALLPWLPPPEPHIEDEFSHLLVADTLAAGHLANPAHVLWRHFETIYVLQQPTYSSIYPIGQGFILAVGKILVGTPWAGVLLSVALMCGAISWALFGCLPHKWAAVGSLVTALHYGLAARWINSYWGGAFCAFGGALLFGALFRLRKSPSLAMGLLVGLGWSIVWLIRPLESLLPLMISWVCLLVFVIRDRCLWGRWLGTIALILSIQISGGCVTALHNRAVTGSVTTLPYDLSRQVYGVPQSFLWQKAIAEPPLLFAEANKVYWYQRALKDQASAHPVRQLKWNLFVAWRFFVGPWYTLPIVLLAFLLTDWRVLVSGGMMTGALAASVVYPFFFPHYIAAYACVISFLIFRGLMKLEGWSFRGRRLGSVVVLFLLLGGSLTELTILPLTAISELDPEMRPGGLRAQVTERLMHLKGRHVVFVRYGLNHSLHDEWVYNAADVDASPIVWCRATDPPDDAEVTQYYKDRDFWIADVDRDAVRVSSYQPQPQVSGVTRVPQGGSQDWILESRVQ